MLNRLIRNLEWRGRAAKHAAPPRNIRMVSHGRDWIDDADRRAREWPREAAKLRRIAAENAAIETRDLLRRIDARLGRAEDMRDAGLAGGSR
ncbi:MAG: hypothetical protein U0575_07370 [Phycisphaerales bacterium]